MGLLHRHTRLYGGGHGYSHVTGLQTGAPRIRDIKDQTLYKIDRQQKYSNLDPIIAGTVKTNLIRQAWNETIRVIAFIHERIVSVSHPATAWVVCPAEQYPPGAR